MKKFKKTESKIITFVVLLFMGIYFISSLALFLVYCANQSRLFLHYEITTETAIFDSIPYITTKDTEKYRSLIVDTSVTVDNLIPNHCNIFESEYPRAIALYTSNGEIVHTDVAVLRFKTNGKDMYCYLDEYLEAEELQQIYDFLIDSSVECDKFEYYLTDEGKVVPVCIGFLKSNFNPDKRKFMYERLDLRFADYENIQKADDHSLELELSSLPAGNEYNEAAHTSVFLRSEKKIYDSLREKLNGNVAKSYVSECLRKGYGLGELNYKPSGWESVPLMIDGSEYVLVIAFGYNPVTKILSLRSFLSTVVTLFFVYTVTAIIVAVFSIRNYNQKQQLEKAAVYFTSAAAHELKTPLAIMQNQCECLMENISPENNEKYQRNIFKEIQRMNKLVNGLLRYTKLNQTDHIKTENNDLSSIVHNEIDKYYDLFEAHCHNIKTEICEKAFVECNNELIALVIDNFLSNAAKHSEDGSDIVIKLQRLNNGYEFSVFNKGANIPEKAQQDIWSVLYKSDESRTSSESSGGMGLAICAKILELHKFKYGYKNVNNGVIFYFFSRIN